MQVWRERSLRATIALLVSSVFLLGPGAAGVDASWLLVGGFVLLAAGLFLVREPLERLVRAGHRRIPTVMESELLPYGRDLWIGPLVAAVVLVFVDPGASPGELQALGGLVGLIAMVNYFVRPIYLYLFSLVRRLVMEEPKRSPE